jgi:hypothetical protein
MPKLPDAGIPSFLVAIVIPGEDVFSVPDSARLRVSPSASLSAGFWLSLAKYMRATNPQKLRKPTNKIVSLGITVPSMRVTSIANTSARL